MKGLAAWLNGILAWLRDVAIRLGHVVAWPFRQLATLLAPPRRLLARAWEGARRLLAKVLAPPRRLLAKVLAPPRRLLSRAWATSRSLVAKVIDPLRPAGRAIWRVVGVAAALLGGVFEATWRGLLLIAGISMPIGGVLLALGLEDTSSTLVTAAFFLGILAVPCWFATRILARIKPPGQLFAGRRRTTIERSNVDEDLSGRADQELHPHDLVLPGEPA